MPRRSSPRFQLFRASTCRFHAGGFCTWTPTVGKHIAALWKRERWLWSERTERRTVGGRTSQAALPNPLHPWKGKAPFRAAVITGGSSEIRMHPNYQIHLLDRQMITAKCCMAWLHSAGKQASSKHSFPSSEELQRRTPPSNSRDELDGLTENCPHANMSRFGSQSTTHSAKNKAVK